MSEKKQLLINIAANTAYMILNYVITFFLTSFVVSEISGEAYGFINLCNNVINYATLITIALNSVAGRFISIEMHQTNVKKANEYFSSVLSADFILCLSIVFIFTPVILYVEYLFDIPAYLVEDVRTLFFLITFNFIITVISTVYMVSAFITNKLYLSSIANLVGNVVRALALIYFMSFRKPSIIYVGLATVLSSLIIFSLNYIYTKKLCPDLSIKKQDISWNRTKELFFSGIWNSVTKLAQILSDGIDLVISNLWIGSYAMGQLSIAYTVPNIIAAFLSMIINVFNPKLTEYYAKNHTNQIIAELKLNMKMTAFFGNVIFFGIITMGKDFFLLWVPSSDTDLVYHLMILSTISILVSSIVAPLSNVFLLTNKLKINSFVWLSVSIFDAVLVIILVSLTDWGVYAVAGVSKIVGAVVNLVFLPVYASMCLNVAPKTFYKLIWHYFGVTVIMGVIMTGIRSTWKISGTWTVFIIHSIILGSVGVFINYILFLNHSERKYLRNAFRRQILKGKGTM